MKYKREKERKEYIKLVLEIEDDNPLVWLMNYEVTNACNGHQLTFLESLYLGFWLFKWEQKLTTNGPKFH